MANEGYDDLEIWKVYQVVPDPKAVAAGCIRVIDESGEDYLSPADRFEAVDFPKEVRARLPRWQRGSRSSKVLRVVSQARRRR